MNPMDMLKSLIQSGKTPEDIVLQILSNNNNPMFKNLVMMAKNGNEKAVENFARNVFSEQGRDFDKEYQDLQNMINSFK